MDFAAPSGPSHAELARTAVARATVAMVICGHPGQRPAPVATSAMATGPAGQPILLPATGTPLARQLAAAPCIVIICVPAEPPHSALRLAGTTQPTEPGRAGSCPVTVQTAELAGADLIKIPMASYRAAGPDPLRREAPGILRHLEHGHMAELVACARAHGLRRAEWVSPTGLDRYGLKLLVFTADGMTETRIAFPDGPVSSFSEVSTSLRAVLACRCRASGHRPGWTPGQQAPPHENRQLP
jgi:Protein of unknown function (DUF2470)